MATKTRKKNSSGKLVQRYIPVGWEEISHPGLPGVVYVDRAGLHAEAYRGKAIRPTWNYRFRSAAQMDQEIGRFFAGIAAHEEDKRKRAKARQAYVPTLKPGDVLYTQWGYEQTNVEFFEVIAVNGKRVTIREIPKSIEETGNMCGIARPIRGKYVGKPITRIVAPGDKLRIDGVRYAWPLKDDGVRCSWYY